MNPVVLRPGFGDHRCTAELYYGRDCRESLKALPPESVNTVVTSPPYWGLRDYGVDGQIGWESSPQAFVQELVGVFREVRRVLREDGVVWLNIGDSYSGAKGNIFGAGVGGRSEERLGGIAGGVITAKSGLPDKNLVGIPWRLAFGLQDDGWILRQDVIWHKKNPLPESVRDRCVKSHEYVFLLTKSPKYWFDHTAIQEPVTTGSCGSRFDTGKTLGHQVRTSSKPRVDHDMRNARSVWSIASQPYKGSHFAVMPPALASRCILTGCPPGGVVLDPFSGSATTGMVAIQEGRNYIGLDLNPDYLDLATSRITNAPPPQTEGVEEDGDDIMGWFT
jgi:DNA modification methylase